MPIPRENIGYVADVDDLQAGDILIFRAPKKIKTLQKAIIFLQSLVNQPSGHSDSTHVAVCTGKNEQGQTMIGHLTEYKKILGYRKEPLQDMINRDGGDRAFIVYRPNDIKIGQKIADVAADEEHNKSIKWKIAAAISAFFRRSQPDSNQSMTKIKKLALASFCSKFAIQCIKVAMSKALKNNVNTSLNYYPSIRSTSTPRTLEAYMHGNTNYQMLVHPGKENPYKLIHDQIKLQIERISAKQDKYAQQKAYLLKTHLHRSIKQLDGKKEINDVQKAIDLYKAMKPLLQVNTGFGLRSAESYESVKKAARKIGIFERDASIQVEKNPAAAPKYRKP